MVYTIYTVNYREIHYTRYRMNLSSFQSVNDPANILQLDRHKFNGRVNIARPSDPNAIFRMQERIARKNKSTTYHDALTGNLEWNLLAQVYFSAENIQIIQNNLRAGVYQMSGNKIVVPPQNIDTLKIIMRSIYLQYAEHYPDQIREQVERLNQLVLKYAIESVYNEAVAYQKYTMDQSTLVVPMDRPLHHDRVYKQLELKDFV